MIRRSVIAVALLLALPFLMPFLPDELGGIAFRHFLYPAVFFYLGCGLGMPTILFCAALAGLFWDVGNYLPPAPVGYEVDQVVGLRFLGFSIATFAGLGALQLRLLRVPQLNRLYLFPLWTFVGTLLFAALDGASFVFFYRSTLPSWGEVRGGMVEVVLAVLVAMPVLFLFREKNEGVRRRFLPRKERVALTGQ